jgi:mono/diheme cytochrome c family protein
LPHQANPSGMTQVWLAGARMGPLNDALIHIGYNRPELFRVLFDPRSTRPQGAVVSLSREFAFPTMSGAVNPRDGQLYVAGFQVWGTTAGRLTGLARVRHTGQPTVLPSEVAATDLGVILRFEVELDASATDPARYLVERWNYQRSPKYGSPHYKLDGSLGQELLPLGSIHLSPDRRSVFISVPDMRAGVMQLRVGWSLRTAQGVAFDNNAYLTPYELPAFRGEDEGFGAIAIDLSPRHIPVDQKPVPATLAEGRRLYEFMGCMACHTVDGVRSFGPAFKGLAGGSRPLENGTTVIADRVYLRESILNPAAKVVKGFESAMPTYAGVLNDTQIESLILYIESVK